MNFVIYVCQISCHSLSCAKFIFCSYSYNIPFYLQEYLQSLSHRQVLLTCLHEPESKELSSIWLRLHTRFIIKCDSDCNYCLIIQALGFSGTNLFTYSVLSLPLRFKIHQGGGASATLLPVGENTLKISLKKTYFQMRDPKHWMEAYIQFSFSTQKHRRCRWPKLKLVTNISIL